jgi:hypothetical protein
LLGALPARPPVAGDRVASVLWRFEAWLSKYVSNKGMSHMESVLSAQTIEKGRLLLGKMLSAGKVRVLEGNMP